MGRSSWITWLVVAVVAVAALVVSAAFLIEPDEERQDDDQREPTGDVGDGGQENWTTKASTEKDTEKAKTEVDE